MYNEKALVECHSLHKSSLTPYHCSRLVADGQERERERDREAIVRFQCIQLLFIPSCVVVKENSNYFCLFTWL